MKDQILKVVQYLGVSSYQLLLGLIKFLSKNPVKPPTEENKVIDQKTPINTPAAEEASIKDPKKILHSPLARLTCTQKFSERPDVYKAYGSPNGHNGLDFRTWVDGNPSKWRQSVFSVFEGVVTESAYDAAFKGNYIRIKHSNDHESVYLHLSQRNVEVGTRVGAAQEIGISGNSGGASEAPHLHFGYRPVKCDRDNGYMGYIDPVDFFIDEVIYK